MYVPSYVYLWLDSAPFFPTESLTSISERIGQKGIHTIEGAKP